MVVKGKFDPNTAENHEDVCCEKTLLFSIILSADRFPWFGCSAQIEKQFAVVAVQHAQIYSNLLEKLDPRSIRLTKCVDLTVSL
jgi:hypothetical protein